MARGRKQMAAYDGKAARAALFADVEILDLFERLERDQRIGPSAPGDGDIVLWVSLAIRLLLADFRKIDRATPFPRQEARPPPGNLPSSLDLMGAFAWMGEGYFYASYSGFAMVPREAWTERYRLFEKHLRSLWGGRRVRVHKRSKKVDSSSAIKNALQLGVAIGDIPKKTGVSRATMYRVLKKQD